MITISGFFLRPEFIIGHYDSSEKSFTPNKNFYKKLDIEKQQLLFADIAECYINNYSEESMFSPYENLDFPKNFVDEKKAAIQWYKVQLEKYRKYQYQDQNESSNYEWDEIYRDNIESSNFSSDKDLESDLNYIISTVKKSDFDDVIHNIKKLETTD